jgi:hypothetical protein
MSKAKHPNSRWCRRNERYDTATQEVIFMRYPHGVTFRRGRFWLQGAAITLSRKQQQRRA